MDVQATCQVERRGGVTLIFGTPAVEDIASITRQGSPDDVLSPELAKEFGATFACGPREAVDALLNDVLAEKPAGTER
ncbi:MULTISPECIES: hypothetical protein [unclassified Rhodanobacter]|uniref:hypothetical protein n=1 Tax=unclassified Rhodanobacter TaxID=2621553 RepID=UPI0007A9B0B2|nr:hypothetical protein [Rhodanobacter sp. FW510-R10]KZC32619.1 hypothetical protein RhoFW510R10_11940 [Rhodanobacter sp. FW510-R10]